MLFLVAFLAMMVAGWETTSGFSFEDLSAKQKGYIPMIAAATATSLGASYALSMIFVWFTKSCTKLVVWGTLLFSPCFTIAVAAGTFLAFPSPPAMMASLIIIMLSLLSISCICCCWRSLIPFTVEVLHSVASVLSECPGLGLVGVAGAFASALWMTAAAAVAAGVWSQADQSPHSGHQGQSQSENLLYFVVVTIMTWGGLVFANACHVTYCGIVGRWYFDRQPSVARSLRAAVTSSGSICLGSLLLAVVHAANALLRKLERDARQARENVLVQCLLCILRLCVQCVEDIVEELSYFSYVQVAIRGFSFFDSARVTFALCSFRNLRAIVACTLISSVVGVGSLFSGIFAGLIGCVAIVAAELPAAGGSVSEDMAVLCTIAWALGSTVGVLVSANILNALRSGFATICVCWAEDDRKLSAARHGLHSRFLDVTRAGLIQH